MGGADLRAQPLQASNGEASLLCSDASGTGGMGSLLHERAIVRLGRVVLPDRRKGLLQDFVVGHG